MKIKTNGIELDTVTHGDKSNPALVLIRGLGSQKVHWVDELINGLVDAGFYVVTFDNRDVGRSDRCPAEGVVAKAEDILAMLKRDETPKPAYHLDDMARDVVGLMDALGIDKAHIFGISMGGAITQILACDHADRLLSATIVMSAAHLRANDLLAQLLVYPQTREEHQESWVQGEHAWGSPGFPEPDDFFREQAGRAWDAGYDAEGINRQVLAIANSAERAGQLGTVDLPVMVIHGRDDTLIPWQAGAEIAELIPNAGLHVIDGMGHTITPKLAPVLAEKLSAFLAS